MTVSRGEPPVDHIAMQAAVRDGWLRKGYAEATMGGERVEVHPGEAAVIAYFEELAEDHAS